MFSGVHDVAADWDGASDTDSQTDVASIIGASLGVAGSVVGAAPGGAAAGAALGTLSGIFSIAEAASGGGGGGGSPSQDLKDLVKRFFGHNERLLRRTLHDVFGGAGGKPGRIPVRTAGVDEKSHGEDDDGHKKHWHTKKVSDFFQHGKWLFLDPDAHTAYFKHHVKKALVSHYLLCNQNSQRFRRFPEASSRRLRHEQ